MANRSKSVRIFAEDDSVHEALAEYLVHQREELTRLYEQTQKAIAAGDLAALARASAAARDAELDAIMADMPA